MVNVPLYQTKPYQTYINSVRTLDVVKRTHQERGMIRTDGDKESENSVLDLMMRMMTESHIWERIRGGEKGFSGHPFTSGWKKSFVETIIATDFLNGGIIAVRMVPFSFLFSFLFSF